MSSARKRSKGWPVPGRTMTLGPVGITVQAPINRAAPSRPSFGRYLFSLISLLRLRQNFLPAIRTFLDVGIIALAALAVVPVVLGLDRLRRRFGLFNIHRRLSRWHNNDLRWVVVRWRVPA